jgi:probable HAF family extracellular repeat protein
MLNGHSALWAAALWRGCWQGSACIAAIWLVCRLFPRLPAQVRYALWWLCCLKLIAGAVLAPSLPLPVLPATAKTASASAELPGLDGSSQDFRRHRVTLLHHRKIGYRVRLLRTGHSGSQLDDAVAFDTRGASSSLSAASMVCILWFVGLLCFVVAGIVKAASLARIISSATASPDRDLLDDLTAVADRLGLRCPRLLQSTAVGGICAAGIIRPVILTPPDWSTILGSADRRIALTHEMAHLGRNDLRLGAIPAMAAALFFFDPLVWLAVRAAAGAREEACDAEALRVSECSVGDYAALLLKAATPAVPAVAGSLGVSGAYCQLRARLLALTSARQAVSRRTRLAAAIGMAVLVALIAPWKLTAAVSHAVRAVASYPLARYVLADLGPITGDDASHFQLNAFGQIVGTSNGHPFLWQQGKSQPLGTVPYRIARGGGVNNAGEYDMTCYSSDGNPHAVYVQNSATHFVQGLPAYPFTIARGVNDGGLIAGSVEQNGIDPITGAQRSRPVLIVNGQARDLGTLGGVYGDAYAVNDAGQVVGKADLPSRPGGGATHAFVWDHGTMHDVGTLGGRDSLAYAINNRGQIAGFSLTATSGARHACLWQNGRAIDLGALPGDTTSEAHGINDRGQVVGTSDKAPQAAANRAVLWDRGSAVDLKSRIANARDWTLQDAMAINNAGEIVGKGQRGGVEHAFLLTPTK